LLAASNTNPNSSNFLLLIVRRFPWQGRKFPLAFLSLIPSQLSFVPLGRRGSGILCFSTNLLFTKCLNSRMMVPRNANV
jgi:hypothetical protein